MGALRSQELGPVALSQLLLLATVVVALVLSSPIFGLSITQSGPPSTVGDGNATVSSVDVDADSVHISPGRFGTDVSYVRLPDASVAVGDVEGSPRIVYRVEIPALDIDHSAENVLSGSGPKTVRLTDVAVRPDRLSADSYDGRLSVRIQSYEVDRVVYNESLTVEVQP